MIMCVICSARSTSGSRTYPLASAGGWPGSKTSRPCALPSSMPATPAPPPASDWARTYRAWNAGCPAGRTVLTLAMLSEMASIQVWWTCMPDPMIPRASNTSRPLDRGAVEGEAVAGGAQRELVGQLGVGARHRLGGEVDVVAVQARGGGRDARRRGDAEGVLAVLQGAAKVALEGDRARA